MEERIQKLLSAAGVCSRRQGEEYLLAGRVTVNGLPASLGDKADPGRDAVALDGVPLRPISHHTYLMLHKPPGYITTLSDEKGRKTAAELVADCGVRVWPVGRLDYASEGLLLLTDDGDLTHRLTHPRHEIEKEYHVTVTGDVEAALPILRGPLELDGQPLAPAQLEILAPNQLRVIITRAKPSGAADVRPGGAGGPASGPGAGGRPAAGLPAPGKMAAAHLPRGVPAEKCK